MIPLDKKNKERKTDRIIILGVMEGKKPIDTSGMPDPRLFNGENELHIYRDMSNGLWKIRYKMGGVPGPLRMSFTTFDLALREVTQYFKRRNVEVRKIID